MASGSYWSLNNNGVLTITRDIPSFTNSTPPWDKTKILRVEIEGNGVTSIGDMAFYGCANLSYVYFKTYYGNSSVTSIGEKAFMNCISLAGLDYNYLPNALTSIGNYAFSGCSRIMGPITIPYYVTEISTHAFENCTLLRGIKFPEGLISIGDLAFTGCSGLTNITLPSSLKDIGGGAFKNSGIRDISFPSGLTSIGSSAFEDCDNLQNVEVPGGVTSVSYNAFRSCNSLKSVALSEGVSLINSYAFSQCRNLSTITLPNSLEDIKANAFAGCSNLSAVNYSGNDSDWSSMNIAEGNDDLVSVHELEVTQKRMAENEVARRYHSVTIGAYNTWTDWRLIPTSRPVVNPPEVKTNFVEVPGADGSLDFTEALDEKIHYKPCEGSWEFLICHEQINIDTNHKYHSENRWATLWHDILNAIHGKRNQIILMDEWREGAEDNRFYVGRVWLNEFISDPSHSRIVFDYNLEPFRYLTTEDAQNRVNGVL